MANLGQAAFMVCLVLAIFAGVGIPWARRWDRLNVDSAQPSNKSEGTNNNDVSNPDE